MYRRTHEEFVEKVHEYNPNIEVTSQFTKMNAHVNCKCLVCGNEWVGLANTMYYQGTGCPKCAIKRLTLQKTKTHEQFMSELQKVNPNIHIIGKYVNDHTKLECECNICHNKWLVFPNNLLRGHGCSKCGSKLMSEKRALRYDDVTQRVETINPNIKIVTKFERLHSRDKVECSCAICNNIWQVRLNNLLRGKGCPNCKAISSRVSNDEFINRMASIDNTIEFLTPYVNGKTLIKCRCKTCGHIFHAEGVSLLSGHGCRKCHHNYQPTPTEFEEMIRIAYPHITLLSKYVNSRTPMEWKCNECGNIFTRSWNGSKQHECRCPQCSFKHGRQLMRNPKLEEDYRQSHRVYPEYYKFVNDVLIRDEFICQLTLTKCKKLCVHHLDGYNWCVERRTDVNNGITLSEEMHKEFHKRYGKGNNTKEQFVDFVNNLFKENRLTKSAYIWVMEERLEINNHLLSDGKE